MTSTNDPQDGATPDPIGNAARRSRRAERLPADAVCVLCGEADLATLRRVPRGWLLEVHHVAFRSNDETLETVLCRNCHAKTHAALLDRGIDPAKRGEGRTIPDVLATILQTLAAFLRALADSAQAWASRLRGLVRMLDANFPSWRDLPEAGW